MAELLQASLVPAGVAAKPVRHVDVSGCLRNNPGILVPGNSDRGAGPEPGKVGVGISFAQKQKAATP